MLSSNTDITDNDWDSVRQSHAALVRDLERIFLSLGGGGNDLGGASPKNANDQRTSQDGNYGYQAVTTDMLDELEAKVQDVTTDKLDALAAKFQAELDALVSSTALYWYGESGSVSLGSGTTACSFSSTSGNMLASISGDTFTAPKKGIYTVNLRYVTGQFYVSGPLGYGQIRAWSQITPPYGNGRGNGFLSYPTIAGGSAFYGNIEGHSVWNGYMNAGDTCVMSVYNDVAPSTNGFYYAHISGVSL